MTIKFEEKIFLGDMALEISEVLDSKNPGSSNAHNNLRQFTNLLLYDGSLITAAELEQCSGTDEVN